MKNAELKVVNFDNSDVIATSTKPADKFIFDGFFDGKSDNAYINTMNQTNFYNYMVQTKMVSDTNQAGNIEVCAGDFVAYINDMFANEGSDLSNFQGYNFKDLYNGTFVWNGEFFTKQ